MPRSISNDSTGRYLVATATGSEHVVNLDDRSISRKMAATAPLVDFMEAGFSHVRRDGEELELLMLESCEVGFPALFWISARRSHPHLPNNIARCPHRAARLACPCLDSEKSAEPNPVRDRHHEPVEAHKAGPARFTVQGPHSAVRSGCSGGCALGPGVPSGRVAVQGPSGAVRQASLVSEPRKERRVVTDCGRSVQVRMSGASHCTRRSRCPVNCSRVR